MLDQKQIHKEFIQKFEKMLDLVAKGRGIEILLRIVHQTAEGQALVTESYSSMMDSILRMNNPHPKQATQALFSDPLELRRIELARDIADKLAHGLYRLARLAIDKYKSEFSLKTILNSLAHDGWKIEAKGFLIEDDGRRIISIKDTILSSDNNLIIEEFDVFILNNYGEAAKEIFNDAWQRIAKKQSSLAVNVAMLHIFRGFKRGKRIYAAEDDI